MDWPARSRVAIVVAEDLIGIVPSLDGLDGMSAERVEADRRDMKTESERGLPHVGDRGKKY